jgi:hypothetical protein
MNLMRIRYEHKFITLVEVNKPLVLVCVEVVKNITLLHVWIESWCADG